MTPNITIRIKKLSPGTISSPGPARPPDSVMLRLTLLSALLGGSALRISPKNKSPLRFHLAHKTVRPAAGAAGATLEEDHLAGSAPPPPAGSVPHEHEEHHPPAGSAPHLGSHGISDYIPPMPSFDMTGPIKGTADDHWTVQHITCASSPFSHLCAPTEFCYKNLKSKLDEPAHCEEKRLPG